MKLAKIQDFEVWKKAEAFADETTAILKRPALTTNFNASEQIKRATDSVLSNMSEGFEQPTDRAFAKYLYIAKGSLAEACTRIGRARKRGGLTETELRALEKQAAEVARMLTGLIKHLMKTPSRQRGLGSRTNDSRLTTHD